MFNASEQCPKTRLKIWGIHVVVSDYKPLLIKYFQVNNEIVKGPGPIYQGSFTLGEEAKTGTYRIRITGKNSASCSFSVEEYVLPKFGVEIEG